MERLLAQELSQHVGETVRVAGWLHRLRQLKSVSFVIIRDRTGLSQVVVNDASMVAQWPEESVIEVTGRVVSNPQAPAGVEIVDAAVSLLSRAEPSPIELFQPVLNATLPTQLDHAAVALRHPERKRAFEIAAVSLARFRACLDALGFTEVTTPKIVASATESGANVFAIDYFGQPAFLAQSPQFYKQTLVGVFERVYEVGPVFRAEPHDTVRHLAQYTSLDVELGFITDHRDVMEIVTAVVRAMEPSIVPDEIPVMHFADAQEMIAAATGEDLSNENDLSPGNERWLGDWTQREHNSDFLFVTGYPMSKRPFYTHPDPERPEFSNSFDLLFRGQELVTGGQRLHLYADYVAALEARGESTDAYVAYLEAFKHGMPPHGGFALGLERWTSRLAGAANIRETTLFPRDRNRLSP